MNADITVIIPTYNKADYISQTIESVLNQAYQNFEVVIVDDCSTDNTEDVVKKYLSDKVRYFKHNKNLGPGLTVNHGIEKSNTEYITFIASDDLLRPNHLELIVQEFKKDECLDVIFSQLAVIDENNNISDETRINTCQDKYSLIRHAFYISNIFPSPGIAFNKESFKHVDLFAPGLILMHDYALNVKIVIHRRFTVLPQITVYYRRFSDDKKNLSALGSWQYNCESFERKIIRDIIFDLVPREEFTSFFPQFGYLGNTKYTDFLLIQEACLSKYPDLNEWGFSRIQKYLNDNPDFFNDNIFNFQYADYIGLYRKRIELNNAQITHKQKLLRKIKKIIIKLIKILTFF